MIRKEKIKLTASPTVYRHEFFLQKTADAEEDTYLILNKLLDEEITILEKIEKMNSGNISANQRLS